MKEYIAVSACLIGINTKYTGGNNYNSKIEELIKDKTVLPICPEVFGGLSIPRDPAEENSEGIFYTISGKDVTKSFYVGAINTIKFLKSYDCKTAILKNGSPSCGKYSYDGSFKNKKIDRMGLTSRMLKEEGFNLIYID
ncbi:DUF523 domain-containing protein [bacterium]|nr:DUF523 domain-containing protein [bacterium]